MNANLAALLSCLSLLISLTGCALSSRNFEEAMDHYLAEDANIEKISAGVARYTRRKKEREQEEYRQGEEARVSGQEAPGVKLELERSPRRGRRGALVTIVQFSDFDCPASDAGHRAVLGVLARYPDDVEVVFKNFPIEGHEWARPAARAALAAGEQGRFWEMHDELYERQVHLSEAEITAAAEAVGLDLARFENDLRRNRRRYDRMIQADYDEGVRVGVGGTPAYFINGRHTAGAHPYHFFSEVVRVFKRQAEAALRGS